MFDVGASEMLMIAIVAIVVIGPKDMPMALRSAGRWIGKMRRISGHFRSGIDTMVREAELEEMERKWREQNEAIMKAHPQLANSDDLTVDETGSRGSSAESALTPSDATSASSSSIAPPPVRGSVDPQIPPPPP